MSHLFSSTKLSAYAETDKDVSTAIVKSCLFIIYYSLETDEDEFGFMSALPSFPLPFILL